MTWGEILVAVGMLSEVLGLLLLSLKEKMGWLLILFTATLYLILQGWWYGPSNLQSITYVLIMCLAALGHIGWSEDEKV